MESGEPPWKRVFAPAASEAGLSAFRPYDLRHSLVSLLIADGRSVVEIAKQAGHSPTMALATYGHVIEELEGTDRRPAAEVIRAARDELVPLMSPLRRSTHRSEIRKSLENTEALFRTRTGDPLLTMEVLYQLS